MTVADPGPDLIKAKRIAFALLKTRSRSIKEIEQRLKLKKFSSATIEKTTAYLKALNLLDDTQFTHDWITARLKKPFGLKRIVFELKEKGISDELINAALLQLKADYSPEVAIQETITKYLLKHRNLAKEKIQERLFSYLTRQGFEPAAVQEALERFDDR